MDNEPFGTARYVDRFEAAVLAPSLDAWAAAQPRGTVLALVAETELARIPILQAACRDRGLTLLGGLFPGLIHDQRFVARGAWLLPLPEARPHVLLDALDRDPASAARRIAAALPMDPGTPPPTLFMLFDAMLPHIASILDALYLELADGVRYLGVNAGNERFQPMPCLFDEERLVGEGVLCLLLPPTWASALAHGYQAPETLVVATASRGNRIVGIDWRPAFEVYREIVRDQHGVELDRDNFYQYAVHAPFGIVMANGQTLVRVPVALDETGAIVCAGEVPDNALLTLLQAPQVDSLDTARALAHGLPARPSPRPLLLFYCAGRRLHLQAGAEQELLACARAAGTGALMGALSLGEIGSLAAGAYPLFHNATLVGIDWDCS